MTCSTKINAGNLECTGVIYMQWSMLHLVCSRRHRYTIFSKNLIWKEFFQWILHHTH